MAAADFPVGHFNLKLVVNEGPLNPKTTVYIVDKLKCFLGSKGHRPERHAIRNLLGVIAFRGKEEQEAKDHFNKILEPGEDPDNLNAKANLDYVKRQTLSDEEYKSGAGIAATCNLGLEISSETEKKKRKGRQYAEQAFAFMYENYHESVTHERYSTAMELYNMAMDLAGDLVDRQEKDDWHLGIGLASMKIFKSRSTTEDAAIKHLKTTVNNNCAVINSESADCDMKSDAYLHIGIASEKASRRNILDKVDLKVPPKLDGIIRDPETCLNKALEVAESDSSKASIYTRLATVRNRDHDFHRAMEFLSTSIQLDGSIKHNYHAYSTRASIYLKQFTFKQKTAGRRGVSHAELHLLTTAQTDLELILKEHVSPLDLFNLAEVYYHLARTSSGSQSKEYIQQAMDTCSKGEECQDGAERPDCHKIKGMSLCFIDEHKQALESFKRGVECEEKTGWRCGNAKLRDEEKTHSK